MKIFDCFTYCDEDLILNLRLNILKDYVDYFVIVESKFKHNGDVKNKNVETFIHYEKIVSAKIKVSFD